MPALGELLEQSAERYPDKPAIIFKERQYTFNDMNKQANRLARALMALGVGKGDKVGIMMPNCPEFIIGTFAALKTGATQVSINALLQGNEVTHVINHSDCKAIIAAPPYDTFLAMLRPRFPKLEFIFTTAEEPEEEGIIPIAAASEFYEETNLHIKVDLKEIASIYYTSGTTGLPKGAMLTHMNVLSNCTAIIKAVQASRNDNALTVLPLFHSFAMTTTIMLPIFGGMTNVLLEGFLPQPVLKGFSDWKVAFIVAVPTMFAVLANMPNVHKYDVSHFRIGFSGGAPLTPAIVEKFESKFPGKIYEGYGLSECSPVLSVNPLGNRKIGSIGKPLDERIQWKIVDENGKEVPRGTVGEIVARGPNIMAGYYKDEDATKQTIRNGWLHTGDLAYMDEDDFVFIADRKKDMVIVGGENVYPKEIEDVLLTYPAIQDAAVIGIPDPIRGEVPKAYIVPTLGASIDEKDILDFCRKNLAPFKVPRSIEVIEDIPRNVTGKILKRVLRRIAAGLPAEEEDDFETEEELGGIEEEDAPQEIPNMAAEPPAAAAPAPGGLNFEEQIRLLEGGGLMPSQQPPPEVAGLSMEEQLRLLEGGSDDEEAAPPPTPPKAPRPKPAPKPAGEGMIGFKEKLRDLVMDTPGGIAGSVLDYDGMGIASFTTDPDFSTVVADAELGGILAAVRKASQSLVAGKPNEAIFTTERYGFFLKTVQNQYLVALIVDAKELNLGLTRLNMNKLIPLIEEELG